MTPDPRAALDRFIAALEAHFDAMKTRRSDDDPRIDDAYDVLADAFVGYDDSVAAVYGEILPFTFVEDDDLDDADDLDDVDDVDDVDVDDVDDLEVLSERDVNGATLRLDEADLLDDDGEDD